MKMLNHEEENIRFIARESLKLDMKSRGVSITDAERNFLGYSLDQNHRLAKTKHMGVALTGLTCCSTYGNFKDQ